MKLQQLKYQLVTNYNMRCSFKLSTLYPRTTVARDTIIVNSILFTRNNHYRDRYNESNIPIVRIITQEYPNDTVSSIINSR